MKPGDVYIQCADLDIKVVVKDFVEKTKKVVYSFEGQEKSWSLDLEEFNDTYRPYTELDVFLENE